MGQDAELLLLDEPAASVSRPCLLLVHNAYWAVVVTMVAVGAMESSVYYIVEMISVRNHLVIAINVVAAAFYRVAVVRVCRINRNAVLIIVLSVGMMQMSVMKIVNVAVMANLCVSAVRPVGVWVIVMYLMFIHSALLNV